MQQPQLQVRLLEPSEVSFVRCLFQNRWFVESRCPLQTNLDSTADREGLLPSGVWSICCVTFAFRFSRERNRRVSPTLVRWNRRFKVTESIFSPFWDNDALWHRLSDEVFCPLSGDRGLADLLLAVFCRTRTSGAGQKRQVHWPAFPPARRGRENSTMEGANRNGFASKGERWNRWTARLRQQCSVVASTSAGSTEMLKDLCFHSDLNFQEKKLEESIQTSDSLRKSILELQVELELCARRCFFVGFAHFALLFCVGVGVGVGGFGRWGCLSAWNLQCVCTTWIVVMMWFSSRCLVALASEREP